jgi:hypothetical protein
MPEAREVRAFDLFGGSNGRFRLIEMERDLISSAEKNGRSGMNAMLGEWVGQ